MARPLGYCRLQENYKPVESANNTYFQLTAEFRTKVRIRETYNGETVYT